jgi:cytochrome c oxidase cbb3-type subunit III
MADFTSAFWSWFIIALVLASIVALVALSIWWSEPKWKSGKRPQTMGHVWDGDLQELNNPLPRWWLNLFYLTLIFGVIYLLLYPGLGRVRGALGWSELGQYRSEVKTADALYGPLYEKYFREHIPDLARDAQAMKTGERLFVNYCSLCHGSDARGAPGFPNLRDGDWLYGGTPEQIKATILAGRAGVMPPWGPTLSRDELFNVTEYVLRLNGRRVSEAAARAGEATFQKYCIACHGPEGKGNPAVGAPNLTNNIWLYGSSQQAVMQSIAEGRQGRMPAFADFLGEHKVHLLAAYVYSLSQAQASQ